MARIPHPIRHGVTAIILLCLLYWARKTTRANNRALPASLHLANDQSTSKIHYASLIDETDLAFMPPSTNNKDLVQAPLHPAPYYPDDFPKHIWQTSDLEDRSKWAEKTATWIKLNPDWEYHHLNDDQTIAFVQTHFAHRPAIVHFYTTLTDNILRADLFRYLALLARGGVYSDIDTSALAPISSWIPPWLRGQHINAIVGIEYDDSYGPSNWAVRPVSFCQWTLAAKPGHPIFQRAVRRAASNLELLARLQRTELGDLKLHFDEVLAATGPGLMSDVVLEVLRDQLGTSVNWASFHRQQQPMLYGDVLVLPINGFAGNQKHSHSGEKAYGEKFVQHHFGKSWYHQKDGRKTRDGVD